MGLPYRTESEIRRAIDELNRSTAAISKQTETLRQQQEALARFAKSRIEDEVARSDFDAVRMHKLAVEIRNAKGQVSSILRPFLSFFFSYFLFQRQPVYWSQKKKKEKKKKKQKGIKALTRTFVV